MRGNSEGLIVSQRSGHLIPAAQWYCKLVYIPWELKDEAQEMARLLNMPERGMFTEALIAGLKWVAWKNGVKADKLRGTDMELVHEAVTGVFRDEERKKRWLMDSLAAEMNRYAQRLTDD